MTSNPQCPSVQASGGLSRKRSGPESERSIRSNADCQQPRGRQRNADCARSKSARRRSARPEEPEREPERARPALRRGSPGRAPAKAERSPGLRSPGGHQARSACYAWQAFAMADEDDDEETPSFCGVLLASLRHGSLPCRIIETESWLKSRRPGRRRPARGLSTPSDSAGQCQSWRRTQCGF